VDQRQIEQEEAIMAKSDQPGTSMHGTPIASPGKSVKIGETVCPELTEDELNEVSGGTSEANLRRASGSSSASSSSAASGITFLRFDFGLVA
jgi:bacteriocin-like protein